MRLTWRPVVAVLLSAVPTFAADSIALKPMFVPGMKWTFDATTAVSLDNKATLNGQSQPFTFKNAQHRVGKESEVVSATDGVPTSIRITFDEASHDEATIAGNEQFRKISRTRQNRDDFPRVPMGRLRTISRIKLPTTRRHELHALIDSEILFLPTHAVAVGEEWPADSGVLSRVLQLNGDDRAGMTLKLLGDKTIDGRDVAEVKVSTVADRREGDMQMRMTLQGTALIDLKTGHAIKSDLSGTLQDHGQQPGPGPDGAQVSYTIEGGGTMSAATAAPLADGAIAAVAPPAENPLGAPAADPFVGTFSDGKLTVTGATKDGGYVASLTMGDQKYPATATMQNHSLNGSFDASGHPFTFSATLDGDVMTMTTGGKTYTLKRTGPASPPAPANPLGRVDAPAVDKLPGYAVAVSTDAGKTLTTNKPQAHDATAAFKLVFPELANYFDGRPTLGGAFQDTRDRSVATASFAAQLNGHPVRGLVSCHITDAGAAIAVTYCRTDADPSAWNKLTEAAPGESSIPPLKTLNFPDNTGSIGIAEGWTTQSQSAMQQVTITGPADQVITIGSCFPVQSPNSQLIQMERQTAAIQRQMGRNPLPTPPQLVAPYSGPAEAMKEHHSTAERHVARQWWPSD